MKFLKGFIIYIVAIAILATGVAFIGGIKEYEIINNIFYMSGIIMAITGFRWVFEHGGYSAITYGFSKLFKNSKKSYVESVENEGTDDKSVKDMKYHEYYNRDVEEWEYNKEVFIYSGLVFIGSIFISMVIL